MEGANRETPELKSPGPETQAELGPPPSDSDTARASAPAANGSSARAPPVDRTTTRATAAAAPSTASSTRFISRSPFVV